MTDLEILKENLLEEDFPYFSDSRLQKLLDRYETVDEASYQGCLIKAQNDSISIGKLKTNNNSQFWLRHARQFQTNYTGSVNRSDGV